MVILTHTSKTMRPATETVEVFRQPQLLHTALELVDDLKSLSANELQTLMKISYPLALKTEKLISDWTDISGAQRAAIDSFLGDIYSGMQVHTWSAGDRMYADSHMIILSGLYGLLRPLDGIYPYRYEMGYKYPTAKYKNTYDFWGDKIANCLNISDTIINLTAIEYLKVLTPYIEEKQFITPVFLTMSGKTKKPEFVTVHTKIARGAYARWLIKEQTDSVKNLKNFSDLNYVYQPVISTPTKPVFICKTFGGLGLSVRTNAK